MDKHKQQSVAGQSKLSKQQAKKKKKRQQKHGSKPESPTSSQPQSPQQLQPIPSAVAGSQAGAKRRSSQVEMALQGWIARQWMRPEDDAGRLFGPGRRCRSQSLGEYALSSCCQAVLLPFPSPHVSLPERSLFTFAHIAPSVT